jgi:hypothetical protein
MDRAFAIEPLEEAMHGRIGNRDREDAHGCVETEGLQPLYVVRRSDGSFDREYYVELAHEMQRRAFSDVMRAIWRRIARAGMAAAQWIDAGCRPL